MNSNHTFFKSVFVLMIFVFFANFSFAQIIFSKGYIVNNNNKYINCLIKNVDWQNNPSKIQYRLSADSVILVATIDSIKEFGVDDFSRFVRASVKIDRSPVNLASLTNNKNPEWSQETLFLRELVCGKATLWSYTDPDRSWYFYSVDNSVPEQLVYKEWVKDDFLGENKYYQQQLFNFIQNDYTKKLNVFRLKYTEKELVHYFKTYNAVDQHCARTDFKRVDREVFNAKLLGAIDYSNFSFYNSVLYNGTIHFDKKINWLCGVEVEYFLPFNRNIWSLLLAPTYEYFTNTTKFMGTNRSIKLQSITFPVGARYTNYINDDFKCYANAYYVPPFNIGFNNYFRYSDQMLLKVQEEINFIVGVGAVYKNFGLELRYYTNRQLLGNFVSISTDYSKVALVASYKLWKLQGK